MFWIYDPSQLFSSFQLVPSQEQTWDEKLNSVSRAVFTTSALLYICDEKKEKTGICKMWREVLIYGLGGTVAAYYFLKPSSTEGYGSSPYASPIPSSGTVHGYSKREHYTHPTTNHDYHDNDNDEFKSPSNYAQVNPPDTPGYSANTTHPSNLLQGPAKYSDEIPTPGQGKIREGFSITPTYMTNDFTETNVAPTYAEEWQVPHPSYDHYKNIRGIDGTPSDFVTPDEDVFEIPTDTRSYPYGQLLSHTNILPREEMFMHTSLPGGHIRAKEFVNDYYTRQDLARRENLSRLHRKKIERRFRQTGRSRDIFSPYKSY